tara:strand:- start:457 stop:879 length:423 start_codon:yes stop_codon:yes gene_type:complete
MTANYTTYQGTVLDNINPDKTIENLDSLLSLYPGYNEQQIDALRHYVGTQALSDKFGPFLTKLMTDFNEWPTPDDTHSIVDLENNAKAFLDMKSGNMLNTSWLKDIAKIDESNLQTSPVLDSLLQHLVLPPSTEEYPSRK